MTTWTPGWYPDPLHRHEVRYHDGARWTEHVSDAGSTGLDPLFEPGAPEHHGTAPSGPSHALPPPQLGDAAPATPTPAPPIPAPPAPVELTHPVEAGGPTGPPIGPAAGTKRSGATWKIVAGIVAVTALVVGLVAVFAGGDGDDERAGDEPNVAEIFLEPAVAAGADPFTPSVDTNTAPPPIRIEPSAVPLPPTTLPATTVSPTTVTPTTVTPTTSPATTLPATTLPTATTGGTRSVDAVAPGLYGGTRNNAACDQEQMIRFLAENPEKGAAWAGVQGITPAEIPTYLRSLTPVVLRADTRVTNYGFRDGAAYAKPAVLQMGTAVLVDAYGIPRARCSCGNPLAPPTPMPSGYVYEGDPWPGFQPETVIVVVNVTNVVVDEYVLVDLNGGYFGRTPGTKTPSGTFVDGDIYIDRLCDLFPTAPECLPPVETVPATVPETLPPTTLPEPVLGTGDIQFTLRWSSTADLDLAVLDPFGEEIDFAQTTSSSGGQLDVDSNASCDTAVTNPVENIFWPVGASPAGVYQVAVRYYAECGSGIGPQPFTLTVLVDGVEVTVEPVIAGVARLGGQVNTPGDQRQYRVDKSAPTPITSPATTPVATTAPPTTPPPTAPPTTAAPVPVTTTRPVVPPTTVEPGETMTLDDYCQQLYGPGAVIGPEYPMYTLCMHDPTVS